MKQKLSGYFAWLNEIRSLTEESKLCEKVGVICLKQYANNTLTIFIRFHKLNEAME